MNGNCKRLPTETGPLDAQDEQGGQAWNGLTVARPSHRLHMQHMSFVSKTPEPRSMLVGPSAVGNEVSAPDRAGNLEGDAAGQINPMGAEQMKGPVKKAHIKLFSLIQINPGKSTPARPNQLHKQPNTIKNHLLLKHQVLQKLKSKQMRQQDSPKLAAKCSDLMIDAAELKKQQTLERRSISDNRIAPRPNLDSISQKYAGSRCQPQEKQEAGGASTCLRNASILQGEEIEPYHLY